MSTLRRQRRAWSPETRARLAVRCARGFSLSEAAFALKIPGRTARGWSGEHYWPTWLAIAGDLVATNPMARDEVLALSLIDRAREQGAEKKAPITIAVIAETKALVENLARGIARKRGLDEDQLIEMAQPTIPVGADPTLIDACWAERLLRLISLSAARDLSPERALIENSYMPSVPLEQKEITT